MYKSIKNDLVYCVLLLKRIAKVHAYASDINDPDDFIKVHEGLNFDASMLQLSQIGELINKLSPELKTKYTNIPWEAIRGFRNRIVHEYDQLDETKVFYIVKNEIPQFENEIWHIIEQELGSGNFIKEEYDVAKNSDYYGEVHFRI
jgi:uncharacterized protein with HEPN domain